MNEFFSAKPPTWLQDHPDAMKAWSRFASHCQKTKANAATVLCGEYLVKYSDVLADIIFVVPLFDNEARKKALTRKRRLVRDFAKELSRLPRDTDPQLADLIRAVLSAGNSITDWSEKSKKKK